MERLTWTCRADGYDDVGLCDGVTIGDAICRLAEYEDTWLDPAEVEQTEIALMGKSIDEIAEFEGVPLARMRELAQAEKDGRLVVLPCKVGAYVWVDGCKAIVEEFFGYKTERYLRAQFYDDMQYVDIPFEEIGKTVFLTREEAEAALKKREADNEAD